MKQFNENEFNCWIQDTQDYSEIKDAHVYVTRKSNDCITYCTKVLGMIPQKAWIVANNIHISESRRLKL